jgi:type I restriction enzyme R subunit
MTAFLDEAQTEFALVELFKGLGFEYAFGPEIACDGPRAERTRYADAILARRLRSPLVRINPQIPADAIEEANRQVTRTETPSLI